MHFFFSQTNLLKKNADETCNLLFVNDFNTKTEALPWFFGTSTIGTYTTPVVFSSDLQYKKRRFSLPDRAYYTPDKKPQSRFTRVLHKIAKIIATIKKTNTTQAFPTIRR